MPNYLQLPDGSYFTVPDGVDPDMGMAMAKDKYPEAFKPPEGGFKAAFGSGVAKLKGDAAALAGRTGLMGIDDAEAYRAKQDDISKRTFKPTEDSWLDSPLTHIKELAGGSLPYMAAPVVAGGAATVLGAPALLATGAAGLASAAQFTGSNLDRQVEEGTKLADTKLTNAALAAIPQAALDMIGFKMMPGIRQIMQLAGKEVSEEAAKRIATQSVKQVAADYLASTGKTMGAEGLTEAAQQVFERMQAGLSLTDEKAKKEYFDNFVGGAVLGGAMSPAGRAVERSGERTRQEAKIKQDEKAATDKAALDAEAAQAAKLQDPAYIADLRARYEQHGPRLQELKAAADAEYDKNDMVAVADHKAAAAAYKEYLGSDGVTALREEISAALPQIRAMEKAAADKKTADEAAAAAEAARPRTPDEIAQMQAQLQEAQTGLNEATETAKAAIRTGDTEAHDTALETLRKHKETIADLTARIPPPAPPAPAIPALDKLNKALQGRLKAYDGAIGTDPDAAAAIAEQIRTLQAQIKEVSPTYAELAGRQDLLKQQKPSKNPVNPMARFMEDNDALDSQRVESEGMRNTAENDRLVQKMGEKELNTGVTEQRTLFDEAPQLRNQTVSGSGAQGKSRAELMAELQIARATGNKAAANAAVEQLQVLKATPPTTGALGMDPSLNAALGVGSVAKNDAAAQTAADNRASAYAKLVQLLDRSNRGLASKEETVAARATVIRSMLEEIEAQRGTPLSNTEKTKITGQVAAPLNELMNRFGDTRDMTKVITGKDTSYLEPAQYENGQWTQQNKNVWGLFDPGMPTVEGRAEGRRTFGNPYAAVQAIGEQLHDIRNAAVHGASAATAVDTTYTTKETSPAALRDAVARLPQNDAFVQRVQDNLPALARHAPEDVAAWAHAMRTGNKADAHAQRVTTALDGLEQGKRSDEQGVQKDAFPDEALQGKAFASRAEFDRYLASDATHQMRADIGLVQQTASRLAARIAPFEKKAAGLRKQVEAAEARVSASDAEAASAQERMETITTRLSNELADLTLAHEQARSAFEQAVKKSRDTSELIHDNQSEFEQQHAAVEAAAQAVVDAKEAMVKAMLKDVSKKNYDSLRKAQAGVVDAVSKHFDMTGELDATTLTFLRADLRLQMDLQEQLANLRGMSDTMTQAARDLDAARAVQERSTKNRRELKAARDGIAAAQEEMIAARGNQDKHRTAFNKLERAIEVHKEAMRSAAEARRAPAAVDSGAISAREGIDGAQRAEEQAHLERRAAMPGERIDHSKYRAARDAAPVDATREERMAKLEAAAANEALPKPTRDKARRQFLAMERENSATESRTNAQAEITRLVEDRIPALEQKVRDNPTAANKQELGKAKRSLGRLQSLLQRAKRTTVGRIEGPLRPAETEPIIPGERSELRGRVSQASKKERIAGEQRTSSPESKAGDNKTGTRNKVREERKIVEPNRSISKTEMADANADADRITKESANKALETERLQRLQEEADDARLQQQAEEIAAANRDAKKAKGKAAPESTRDNARQERAPAKAKTSRVFDDIYNESPFNDDFAGEYEASFPKTNSGGTPAHVSVEYAVTNNDVDGVVAALAKEGSTPEVRALAQKLAPYVGDVKISMAPELAYQGVSVAGLYSHSNNSVQIHSGGMFEDTILHELMHAATMQVLDRPAHLLTSEQHAAMEALQRLFKSIEKNDAFKGEQAIDNLKEFVAEVYTNEGLRAKLDAVGKPQTLLQRVVAQIKRLLGMGADPNSKKAMAAIDRLMEKSGRDGTSAAPKAADFGKYDGTAITVGTPEPDKRGWIERMTGGLGMALEHGIVDMHAPLMRALDAAGNSNAVMQAKYAVREADASISWVQSFLSYGAPEAFKDSKGMTGIRASKGMSGADVLRLAEDIPGNNAAAKYHMATIYMAAERALRVGADKVGIPEEKLEAVRRQVAADPALKKSLEAFRKGYNKYNEKLVNFARDTGGISSDKAREFLEHGDYVPLYRVRDGQLEMSFGDNDYVKMGDIANTPFLHKLKGSDSEIMPINESIIFNTKMLSDIALTNLAKRNVGYVMAAAGKPVNKMQVRMAKAPAGKEYLSWTQEPIDEHDTGDRYIKIDTAGTVMEGVPSTMLAQSIEGFHAMMPAYVHWAAKLNDYLRAGVTRMPPYTVRQLLRDPFSAASTSGLAANPLTAVGRAMAEYRRGMGGDKTALEEANRHALVQSNLFTGDHDDMIKLTQQIADGNHPNAVRKLLNTLDRSAHVADATTRIQIYKDSIARGLSEVEAAYRTRESMNFHKRGGWGSIQHFNRMLPFFNSGIQALNVATKALQGKMPFEEQLKVKQTFVRNAMMLAIGGMVYAAMKADDDEYTKLRPGDRYGNFHIGLPGTDAMLKIPVGYASGGGMAWAAGQALIDAISGTTEGKQVAKALAGYAMTDVPGGGGAPLPTGLKQAVEWATNTDLRTYLPIVGRSLAGQTAGEQYNDSTPEAFKAFGALGISPLQLQHAVNGLTGSAASVVLTLLERAVGAGDSADVEKPSLPLTKMPWVKSFVQNPNSDANAEAVYDLASNTQEVKKTFDTMQREGRSAKELRAFFDEHKVELALASTTGEFVQKMGEINTEIKKITNAPKDRFSGDRKTDAIDRLNKRKQEMSKRYMESIKAAETRMRASAA